MARNRRGFLKNGIFSLFGIALPATKFRAQRDSTTAGPVITIREGKAVATLITVVTVNPENKEKLIALFISGTNELFSRQPGFISESIHTGNTTNQLVLYGQWENAACIDAFRKKPEIAPYFKQVRELAQFESVVCTEVAHVHHK